MRKIAVVSVISIFLSLSVFLRSPQAEEIKKENSITAVAKIDKDSVLIGDKLKYTVEVEAGKDVEVEFPSFDESFADFTIRDFGSSQKIFFGKKKLIRWYLLDTYTTGEYAIPEAVIKYRNKGEEIWDEIEIDEVKVEVKSLLEQADSANDICDIKSPLKLLSKARFYILLGVLLVLILSILGLWFFLKRRKAKQDSVSIKSPYQIASEALEELEKKNYLKGGKIKEYYAELSFIIRSYLEGRFSLRAPEMTTEEFLNIARDARQLSREQKNLLKEFLSHCDLVKFAKYGPSSSEINASFQSAKELIGQTKESVIG